jgi:hypothetical protein
MGCLEAERIERPLEASDRPSVVQGVVKPVWEFLWFRTDEPESKMKVRKYRCAKLITACKRMAKFLSTRNDEEDIRVDYEARALHRYNPANRQLDEFVDLYEFDNPLKEYLS